MRVNKKKIVNLPWLAFFCFFIFTLLRNMLNIISFSKKNYNFKLERRKETVKDTVSEVL